MKSPEEVKRQLYEKWMRRADEDLAVAEQLVSDGVPYFGSIGFHAQQAAEKFLKAFLVWHQIEFPKTHDLNTLLQLVATRDNTLLEALQGILVLTDYGVETRYPADLPDLTSTEASWSVELARQAKDAVLKSLSDSSAPPDS
jgi:HEPN domain-containing protein